MKRTTEARDILLGIMVCFAVRALMQYNIACYECQLGNLNQAREHLDAAFALSGGLYLRPRSLDEPDLAPLWPPLCAPL